MAVSHVIGLGCTNLSLESNGIAVCGGCLDKTPNISSHDLSTTASVSVSVTSKARCTSSSCMQSLYDSIVDGFNAFIVNGVLTKEIVKFAKNSIPQIEALYYAETDAGSFSASDSFRDPFQLENIIYVPDWTTCSCISRSNNNSSSNDDIYAFSSASIFCNALFGWKESQCCEEADGC